MKIRNKLQLTFISIALLFAIIGFIEHQFINRVTQTFRSLESITAPTLTALLESIAATRRASIKAVEYSMRGKPVDRDKAHEALQQLEDQVQQYLELSKQSSNQSINKNISLLKNKFRNAIYDYLSLSEGPDVKQVFTEQEALQTDRRELIQATNAAIQQAPEYKYDLLLIKSEARKVSIKLVEFTLRGINSDKQKAQQALQILLDTKINFEKTATDYPQIINTLSDKINAYILTASTYLQLISAKQTSVDAIYQKEEDLHLSRKNLIKSLYPLIEEQYLKRKQISETTTRQLGWSSQLQYYSILVITLIALLASYWLAQSISKPLKLLAGAAQKVGEGDLDVNLNFKSRDEIGQLTHSFRQMVRDLKYQYQQVKENEEKFSKAFFDQSIAMQIVNLETNKRVEVNRKFCELTGYPRDELLNNDISINSLWVNPELQKDQIKTIRRNGYIDDWPMDLRQKSGAEKNTLVSAATLKLDQQELIIATHIDITDRLRLEQEIHAEKANLERSIKLREIEFEKLLQTEKRLENAQQIAHIGNWELDITSGKLHWSDEIYRIFDIDQNNFAASYDAFLDSIHPQDRYKVNRAYKNSLKNKTPYTIEHRLLMKDGTVKYVIEKCETKFADDGTPLLSLGTVQDITERKLNESLAYRMNRMFELSVEEIYIFEGQDLNFLKVSRGALQNLGYNMQEMSELTSYDINPEFNQQQFRQYIEPLLSGRKQQLKFETLHQRKDGSTYPVSVRLQYAAEDVTPVFLAIIEDLTERKKIENELESYRLHLEKLVEERTSTIKQQANIIDQTNDSVITVDLDGNITSWNGGAERLFNISAERAMGQHITLVYPDNSEEFLQKQIVDPVREKGVHEIEVRLKRSDGSEFPAHLSLSLLYDENGEPIGTVGYSIDITEQKKREKELLLLTRKLQDSNKELEAFSYSVSHDLRSPLRTIDGFSLAIIEDYGELLDDTGKDYLDRVRKAAQRMGLLIDELLDLSRVNRVEMDPQQLNLNEIAQRSFDELKTSDPERQVELFMDKNMQVRADARLFGIIMDNLIGNAWKFTAQQEKAQITIKTLPDKPNVFYIKDNGVGFDMRHADKLFGVFQRLHQVRDFPGTGVGLATVQRIIHRHGGSIWAKSEPEKGATFFFTLDPYTPEH